MMKTKNYFVLLVMVALLSNVLFAQKNTRKNNKVKPGSTLKIDYDYLSSSLSGDTKPLTVKYRSDIHLKVTNINPFLFKVKIEDTSYSYFTERPDYFDKKGEVGLKDETKEAVIKDSTYVKIIGDSLFYKPDITDLGPILTIIENAYDSYNQLEESKFLYNMLWLNLSTNNLSFKKLDEQKADILDEFCVMDGATSIDVMYDCNERLNLARENLRIAGLLELGSIQVLKKEEEQLANLKTQVENFNYDSLFIEIDKVIAYYLEENFTRNYYLNSVECDEKVLTIQVDTIKKKGISNLGVMNMLGPIKVRVKGGWKIDFSTGLFFKFGLDDKIYSMNSIDSTQFSVEEKKNKNSFIPALGGMMHIYPRQARDFKWGGIGFGVGTDGDELSYYLGTGIIIGHKERFVINGGLAAANVSVLSSTYDVNEPIEKGTFTDIPTEKVYQLGGFLSITYNLTKSKTK